MPDILSDVPIRAAPEVVFTAVSSPAGLNTWWTKTCAGNPGPDAVYALGFGPGYDWQARVSAWRPGAEFELELVRADPDWLGTRVGFALAGKEALTQVRFHHTGWPAANEHWRVSCYCWPIYLRLLRRSLEYAEFVPYEKRLDA
jgi:uncharacterized protein YndB with AHSA1/START domain